MTRPTASRPWDRDRDGFVLAEGAGVLVLEEYEHARRARGAAIYAELIGFGMSADAYHMTAPPEDGEARRRQWPTRLRDAGVDAGEIGYINAHGTSTPLGDWPRPTPSSMSSAIARHASRGQLHEVDDRPPARRRRRHRGGIQHSRAARPGRSADHQPRQSPGRLRPRLHAAHRRATRGSSMRCPTPSASAGPMDR